jgi:hypothetical protein
VIIFDRDIDFRQMSSHRGFEVSESDGLKPHVGIVKVTDRWLDE